MSSLIWSLLTLPLTLLLLLLLLLELVIMHGKLLLLLLLKDELRLLLLQQHSRRMKKRMLLLLLHALLQLLVLPRQRGLLLSLCQPLRIGVHRPPKSDLKKREERIQVTTITSSSAARKPEEWATDRRRAQASTEHRIRPAAHPAARRRDWAPFEDECLAA